MISINDINSKRKKLKVIGKQLKQNDYIKFSFSLRQSQKATFGVLCIHLVVGTEASSRDLVLWSLANDVDARRSTEVQMTVNGNLLRLLVLQTNRSNECAVCWQQTARILTGK